MWNRVLVTGNAFDVSPPSTTMIAVTDIAVSSRYIGSEKLYKTAEVVADDDGDDGTSKTISMVEID